MYESLAPILNALQERAVPAPQIGIVLGSGLGGLADQIEAPVFVDYHDLPGFPVSTAPGPNRAS